MKLSKEWLKEKDACPEGIVWFENQEETDGIKVLEKLMFYDEKEKYHWANWLIVRILTKKQRVQYAIYAAEKVLHIFEEKYPDDKRPRKAIEAARNYLKNPTEETKKAAYAANAAYAAADAANAAYAAADAANAAYAAADAAYAAAYDAAYDAAYAAAADDNKNYNKTLKDIIEYGIKLIKGSIK